MLQVDPEAPDIVYAAVSLIGGGVFRRQGDGPWEDVSAGLPNLVVPALSVEARPQPRLIASTEAGVRVLAPCARRRHPPRSGRGRRRPAGPARKGVPGAWRAFAGTAPCCRARVLSLHLSRRRGEQLLPRRKR